MSLSLSLAAVICAVISRTICTRMGYGLANLSTQAASVDAAIAAGPTRTSLLLVLLLRLSPVRPPPSHGAGGSARGGARRMRPPGGVPTLRPRLRCPRRRARGGAAAARPQRAPTTRTTLPRGRVMPFFLARSRPISPDLARGR